MSDVKLVLLRINIHILSNQWTSRVKSLQLNVSIKYP